MHIKIHMNTTENAYPGMYRSQHETDPASSPLSPTQQSGWPSALDE